MTIFFRKALTALALSHLLITCALATDVPTKEKFVVSEEKDGVEIRQLYTSHCAVCHDRPGGRVAPKLRFLSMTPYTIYRSITVGSMRTHAKDMTDLQKRKLSVGLAYAQFEDSREDHKPNLCIQQPARIKLKGPNWNGWGNSVENFRFQPTPGISAVDVPRLKLNWAYAYPKSAGKSNGQPTVIGDRVFVTSEGGFVYSLNAKTGCSYWTHEAESGVRTAIVVGAMPLLSRVKAAVYFGDGSGFVYALNADTGKRLWKTQVETHLLSRLTGAPVLHKEVLYVPVSSVEEIAPMDPLYPCCTFRGSVVALNAHTGKVLWQAYMLPEPKPFKINSVGVQMFGPAGAAIWSTPTLDLKRRTIYVGTGNSYTDVAGDGTNAVVAIDMDNGTIKWKTQFHVNDTYLLGCSPWESGGPNCPSQYGGDLDFGSSPILQKLPTGEQLVIIGGKSAVVTALKPDDGTQVWQTRVGRGGPLGGVLYGMAANNDTIFAPTADTFGNGVPEPGIAALASDTGKKIWNAPAPAVPCTYGETEGGGTRFGCSLAQSAAVTAIPGVVFSGALNAHLRGYDSSSGKIIWDYFAGIEYDTVNGVKARGGSFDGGGPTVVNGMLYVNSGYGSSLESGNVLLAFSVDGE